MRVSVHRGGKILGQHRFAAAFAIGRDVSCQIVLDAEEVSRRHLFLTPREGRWLVRDTSSNGSQIDGRPLRGAVISRADSFVAELGPYQLRFDELGAASSEEASPPAEMRRQIHEELVGRLRLDRRSALGGGAQTQRDWVGRELRQLVSERRGQLPPQLDVERWVGELEDEVLGLGPLESLLADESVSEIMVVSPERIYVERQGRIERSERRFSSVEATRAAIERIVTPLGRRIDEATPYVDARLADGSRVHAIIPPLALGGPCITIRKFRNKSLGFEELLAGGSLSAGMMNFLRASVRARKNIIVSGGTGSGKTTTLNLLSQAIPRDERIVTIEDAAELSLAGEHVVSLEARPPNLEGKGEVSIRELLRNALRMRPDRIIVGECRGGETLDMLQAMNTGHEGSMTTTHASSPRRAISRLETLVLMSGVELPLRAVRECIGSSVDLVCQQERGSDGVRRITSITEVLAPRAQRDLTLVELYRYCPRRALFSSTGRVASYLDELVRRGWVRGGELL